MVPWGGLAPGDTWALASCEHKAKGSSHCGDFLWFITGLWNCREPKQLQRPRHNSHQLGLLRATSSQSLNNTLALPSSMQEGWPRWAGTLIALTG